MRDWVERRARLEIGRRELGEQIDIPPGIEGSVNFIHTIVYLTLMKTTVLGVHGHLLVVKHCHYKKIW